LNDQQIDNYITSQTEKRDVTLYDIIGGPCVDPDPGNMIKPFSERVRQNRFTTSAFEYRLCELLTEDEFDSDYPYENLAIPIKDIVRYWWNRIADQEAVLEGILEDIMVHYKDGLLPEEPEHETFEIPDAFDEVMEAV
jgi:hypothetical protein